MLLRTTELFGLRNGTQKGNGTDPFDTLLSTAAIQLHTKLFRTVRVEPQYAIHLYLIMLRFYVEQFMEVLISFYHSK